MLADLEKCNLMNASLTGALMFGTNFKGAFMSGADLSNAHVGAMPIFGADGKRTGKIRKTDMSTANLNAVKFDGVDMNGIVK